MNKIKEIGLIAGIGTIAVLLTLWIVGLVGVKPPLGGAKASTAALIASSTIFSLSTGSVVQIAATSTCTTRIIATGVAPVELQFGDRADSFANLMGSVQAASSTVAYDGSLYGCGMIKAKAEGVGFLRISEGY